MDQVKNVCNLYRGASYYCRSLANTASFLMHKLANFPLSGFFFYFGVFWRSLLEPKIVTCQHFSESLDQPLVRSICPQMPSSMIMFDHCIVNLIILKNILYNAYNKNLPFRILRKSRLILAFLRSPLSSNASLSNCSMILPISSGSLVSLVFVTNCLRRFFSNAFCLKYT